jgi:hypothetical protein
MVAASESVNAHGFTTGAANAGSVFVRWMSLRIVMSILLKLQARVTDAAGECKQLCYDFLVECHLGVASV